jgi:hypothetical protein
MPQLALESADILAMTLFLVAVMAVYLVFFILPSYSYELGPEALVIHRRILGRVPFGTFRIRVADIKAVERSGLGLVPFGTLRYGWQPAREGVVLVLRRPRYLFWSGVLVTPPDPEAFLAELHRLTGAEPGPPLPRGRTPLDRVPLWAADSLSVASATVVAVGYALTATHALSASQGSLGLYLLASAPALSLWALMFFDGIRSLALTRERRYALWLAGLVAFALLAWLYYWVEWRPRRLGRSSGLSR